MNKVEDILFKKLDLYEMLYYCMNPIGYIEKNNIYRKKYAFILKYVPDYYPAKKLQEEITLYLA